MKASKSSVWDLFNGAKQYVVPLFQRPYVWSGPQWDQLWSDITEQCQARENTGSDQKSARFLGSIVVVREYEKNLDKYTIIDGQQRITTISIILAVIRAFAKERGLNELYGQISDFIRNSPRSGEGQYVVVPTRVDKPSLFHIFDEDYSFEKDTRIIECFDFFWRKIDESSAGDLNALQQVITEDLCVVYIELDQGENPNQVFEALNCRGVPLEESDLIRNFFFAGLGSAADAEIQYDLCWKPMEERFDNRQEIISRFLRYFCMRSGNLIRTGEVFETIRRMYLGAEPARILSLLRDINRYSEYYIRILHPDEGAPGDRVDEDLRRHLIRIRVLGADSAAPFLMNCFSRAEGGEDGGMTRRDLVRVTEIIESYLLRRAVCGKTDLHDEEIFIRLCREIEPGAKDLPELVASFLAALDEPFRMPGDDEFDDHLRKSDLFHPGEENAVAWIVLTGLEEYFSSQSSPASPAQQPDLFDDGPQTEMIDHIMPCTATAWWQDHLGPDWQAIHETQLHRLGNLTLTMENPAIMVADFDTKKAWYSLDNHLLNTTLRSVRIWRKFQIDQRSGVLAAFCRKIWPGHLPAPAEEGRGTPTAGMRSGEIPKAAKPVSVTIRGEVYPVRYWYQVLEVTVNAVHDREPQKFDRILREWPGYFSDKQGTFKSSVGPYSFKSRFGRYQIRDMCVQMIRLMGWSDDSWSLELI